MPVTFLNDGFAVGACSFFCGLRFLLELYNPKVGALIVPRLRGIFDQEVQNLVREGLRNRRAKASTSHLSIMYVCVYIYTLILSFDLVVIRIFIYVYSIHARYTCLQSMFGQVSI